MQAGRETILHLHKLHSGWGPNTLLATLKMDEEWRNQMLPSRARIAILLKQAGLINMRESETVCVYLCIRYVPSP
jgi:hypothetical protein